MEDYPSNSKKVLGAKEPGTANEKKKIERVTTSEVIQKPKGLGRRMKDLFIGADVRSVSTYVVGDVLLPALKNMIVDATSRGVERIFWGDRLPRRYSPPSSGTRVTYNAPVQRSYNPQASPSAMLPGQPPAYNRGRRDSNEIIFATRSDADAAIESFSIILEKYEAVSVSDLHDMVGLPASHTDQKWGWTSAAGVSIHQTRDGYVLDLPPAEPI